jgi:crotonobetainyl-CoA:carnitine CoA-transferase CaiB-like acyl-CoA transferase
MGADVIAVEPPGGAWHRHWSAGNRTAHGQSLLFLAANRNKRSLALNLKSVEGIAIARTLLASADVLAENFRPGVLAKMGLGYEDLRKENPRLIYASVSGYGQDGPYVERPGQDLLIQAMSGLAAITGNTEDPARAVGVSVVDHHGAALFAMSILAALVGRTVTGTGSRVEVDLLSAGLDLQTETLVSYFNGEKPEGVTAPPRLAGWHYAAPYGIYPTMDGHLAISLAPLAELAKPLELPELAAFSEEEAYSRRREIAPLIEAVLKRRPTAAWLEVLEAAGIWHAPVNDYDAVARDPQVRHNETLMQSKDFAGLPVTLVRHPVRYDGQSPEVRFPPQPLGAQTEEILGEIGFSTDAIGELVRKGVVAAPPRGTDGKMTRR